MFFKGEKEFPITYWYGPPASYQTVETYQQVKASGMTWAGPQGKGTLSVEENLELLDICAKTGLKLCVCDARMKDCVLGLEGWEKKLADLVASYKDCPALHSYYVTDEPSSALFAQLGKIVARIAELDPAHPAYINLYPNYAPPQALGNETYYEHIAQYLETVKPAFLSYDHYHFIKAEALGKKVDEEFVSTGDEREDMIRKAATRNVERSGFFTNLEEVRELCAKAGVPFMVIVLLIEHGGYRNVTEAELRYEVFQSLAYGASCLSYFTYWTVSDADDAFWNWKNGMMDTDGTPLQHYHEVQRVNRDLAVAGKRLLPLDSVAVSHVGPEEEKVTAWTPNDDILSLEAERLTVGQFTQGYYVLANKDFVVDMPISLQFASGRKVWLLDRAADEEREVALCDGKLSITLEAGDMALLRIEVVP